MRSRALVALVALCTIADAPARAEARRPYGGAIVATLYGEPATVDPVAARSHAEISLVGLIFDTLYRIDARGAVVPALAAGPPEVATDGLHVRIPLRAGVLFHDGSGLGVADVIASLARLGKSDAGWIVAPVAAFEDGSDATGPALAVTLRGPTPGLAALLAQPQTAITPHGAAPRPRAPIGSGPFRMLAIDRGKRTIALRGFDAHFAGRPYLDELELRWFANPDDEPRLYETGGAQLSLRGDSAFAGHAPKYASGELESAATILVYVGFGRAHPAVLANPEFRAALHHAVGRGGFATIGSGERAVPALDPVPTELGGAEATGADRTGDLDQARAALGRAGKAVAALAPAALAALRLEILVDDTRPDDREVGERIVRALDKLGITATITALDAVALAARRDRGDFDLLVGQVPMASTNPGLAWAAAFAAGGDDWARQRLLRGAIDAASARAQFAKSWPVVPLYFRAVRINHRTDVRGLGFDGTARLGLADAFVFGAPRRSGPP
jgi:peptide/nickel transport system substrate-binding protein